MENETQARKTVANRATRERKHNVIVKVNGRKLETGKMKLFCSRNVFGGVKKWNMKRSVYLLMEKM